jgi:predicted GH43/DUF377 family glycosyl hydrolase
MSTLATARAPENPILTPAMVVASRPDLEVVGVFNPAAIRHRGEVILLLRVAEGVRGLAPGELAAPIFDPASARLDIKRWRRGAPGVDASDPRLITVQGRTWLTSISHLRVARSTDGVRFTIDPTPALSAATLDEAFGVEDPRITLLGDTYWINYTAVSSRGIATALASTTDFVSFRRHGVIFPPDNRDVSIFPETIADRFVALHRPMPSGIGEPAIWMATSPDLLCWGHHRLVASARPNGWEGAKIGGGAVPVRVRVDGRDAWLVVYHGVAGSPPIYSLGALLLDYRDPSQVIGRSREPILRPEAPYEQSGFFGGVVFTCGLLVDDGRLRIYYGAADGVTAAADLSLDDVLAGLGDP